MNYLVSFNISRIYMAREAGHASVILINSKFFREILRVLKEYGIAISHFELLNHKEIKVTLKHDSRLKFVIFSVPGRRVYAASNDLKKKFNSSDFVLISTSSGVLTLQSALEMGLGGEIIMQIQFL